MDIVNDTAVRFGVFGVLGLVLVGGAIAIAATVRPDCGGSNRNPAGVRLALSMSIALAAFGKAIVAGLAGA